MTPGLFDKEVRQAQLGRDGKGITLSGDTDEQAIGRTQGFHVKFTAGIFHAGSGQGKDLQLAVMGGCHGADAHFVQMGEDGDGKSRTLGGVGSSAKLIKQHQRI